MIYLIQLKSPPGKPDELFIF